MKIIFPSMPKGKFLEIWKYRLALMVLTMTVLHIYKSKIEKNMLTC
jgi:hypothetical protein